MAANASGGEESQKEGGKGSGPQDHRICLRRIDKESLIIWVLCRYCRENARVERGIKLKAHLPFALALVLVGLLVLVITSYKPSADEATVSPEESQAIKKTETLLAGIPQRGIALGEPTAPVTLQFFGDLQCRQSRQVMLGALPFLIRRWVRDGDLRILYRSLKTDSARRRRIPTSRSRRWRRGERAGVDVNLFYREQLPEFTRYADDTFLEGIARQAGVSLLFWAEHRDANGLAGKSKPTNSWPKPWK